VISVFKEAARTNPEVPSPAYETDCSFRKTSGPRERKEIGSTDLSVFTYNFSLSEI
jgi:hypothetical protein